LNLFRHCVKLPANNQPLLDYSAIWDISRDWERMQRTTTLHWRLVGKDHYFMT